MNNQAKNQRSYSVAGIILSFAFCLGPFASSASVTDVDGADNNNTWIKIDDFEQAEQLVGWHKADTKNDTAPYVKNPQITEVKTEHNGNRYLLKKPAADGVIGNRKALSYKALPVVVKLGETFTFYTRINVESFPNNHVFGISNMGPQDIQKHDYNAFEPSLRITDKAESNGLKNDGTLMVKVEKGYQKIQNYYANTPAKPLEPGQWYEIWYVVNNAKKDNGGQSYSVYIRGGSEFNHQTLVFKNATFRMRREKPLIYFLTNSNTGPQIKPYGNGGLLYDDLYMAKGVLLSTPIAH